MKIYISGPITKGNRTINFAQAAEAQRRLMNAGFAVLNPMLSMSHSDAWNIPHEEWLQSDFEWIKHADVVLRLPGESVGADRENALAEECGISVVRTDHFDCLSGLFTATEAQERGY